MADAARSHTRDQTKCMNGSNFFITEFSSIVC